MGSKENWLTPKWLGWGLFPYITLPVILLPITALFSLPLIQLFIEGVRGWITDFTFHRYLISEFADQPGLNLTNARMLFRDDLYAIPGMIGMLLLFLSPLIAHLLISLACIKAKRATKTQVVISIICTAFTVYLGFLTGLA
jgi:hypothetical protein